MLRSLVSGDAANITVDVLTNQAHPQFRAYIFGKRVPFYTGVYSTVSVKWKWWVGNDRKNVLLAHNFKSSTTCNKHAMSTKCNSGREIR